jgi:hypothetical protein
MSGKMYTGTTADGSDMKEFEGLYLSPDGNQFSNVPWPLTKEDRMYWEIRDHIDGKRSLQDEYDLIKAKKSTLSRALRDFLVKFMDEG